MGTPTTRVMRLGLTGLMFATAATMAGEPPVRSTSVAPTSGTAPSAGAGVADIRNTGRG